MSYAPWMAMMGPDDEPDYHAYWQETESLADAMIDIATYDDWFSDLTRPIASVQQGGESSL
ncbi:Hypothetical protein OINT_2001096 [Brucella intermedia LMG 3301]|uniref:Uncharacterized protein n=1 Tax=Brucella intermedia LMG 3301 TaxID=641118 RepID=C4WNF1_9HYPH|nr:hypothetical protein [Brucella intermedia]EEQ93906.1 Hypothetical protein OINT_2001096 [Brucella intermedia LMG 3301]NKB96386.1 hypothetical protein [Brucella intermedia]SUA86690.1 Uncharacterised protein [Brucella intermedia]